MISLDNGNRSDNSLRFSPLRQSIACRMLWASRRSTTRPEDLAYCLLCIFAVNMPMLCGEETIALSLPGQPIHHGTTSLDTGACSPGHLPSSNPLLTSVQSNSETETLSPQFQLRTVVSLSKHAYTLVG